MTRLPMAQHWFVVLNALVLLTSQLLLKMGLEGTTLSMRNLRDLGHVVRIVVGSPALLAGVVLGAISTLLWIVVLSRLELSYAAPLFNAIYYVLMIGASVLLLHEALSIRKIAGVILIIAGIVLITSISPGESATSAHREQSVTR